MKGLISIFLILMCSFTTVKENNIKCDYKLPEIKDSVYYVSDNGKNFIKDVESCRLTSYKDGKYYSIGYGHNAAHVTEDMVITKEMADIFFEEDIKQAEASLNRLLKDFDYRFPQGFVDGMASLIYNCGEYGVKKSDFYQKLCKCRIRNGIIDESDIMWTLASVLEKDAATHIKRRTQEYNMMVQDFQRN